MDTGKYLITLIVVLLLAFGALGLIGKAITKQAERTAETIRKAR